ncbi:hypothetical protein BU16DRAFT_343707 [Lophium mytilinum]|uniref:Uncharacterized protein n=1 Tax=Lophium mytilinum TaxID=390894 RepID=A0A6A6QXP4_9PEZI|nr:hypothetical protein BU16DRAFT_343707 [Lophium mytilinum]
MCRYQAALEFSQTPSIVDSALPSRALEGFETSTTSPSISYGAIDMHMRAIWHARPVPATSAWTGCTMVARIHRRTPLPDNRFLPRSRDRRTNTDGALGLLSRSNSQRPPASPGLGSKAGFSTCGNGAPAAPSRSYGDPQLDQRRR